MRFLVLGLLYHGSVSRSKWELDAAAPGNSTSAYVAAVPVRLRTPVFQSHQGPRILGLTVA
jgi:hypothetical protein